MERDVTIYNYYRKNNKKYYNYSYRGNIIKKIFSIYLLSNETIYNFLILVEDIIYLWIKKNNYLRNYLNYLDDKENCDII